jgi:hypothetical protein
MQGRMAMRIDKYLASCALGSRKQVHELIKSGRVTLNEGVIKNKLTIGFTYLNDLMSATEVAYKPYIMDGKGANILSALNSFQKALMRFSAGFLLRNAMDTFNQLMTDMYRQKGALYMMTHPRVIVQYLQYGWDIYSIYKALSEERLFTLEDIHNTYMLIEETND